MLELYGGVGGWVCGVEIAIAVESPPVSVAGKGGSSRWGACVSRCG